ncbi:MAG: PfkB family carbohydrate kinase [Pseudomonadota bacterium]
MSLLVVGSVALDSVETPHETRERILGGSASFFSVVASLITPVRLVAVVGEDFPDEHLELFRQRKVDIQGLKREKGKTFFWRGRYLDNMVDRETLDTQLNVFEKFEPVLPDAYKDSEYVFLANIDPRLQLQVLGQIRDPKFVACDTMNFWLSGESRKIFEEVLKSVDLLFLNDEEARLLSGEHSLVKAAAAIRKKGVGQVIVKRGDAGAQLYDEYGVFLAPAFPLENVVDPTGAGDSFAGGFMAYLAYTDRFDSATIRRAMIFGSAMASFAVEAFSVDRFRKLDRDTLLERCCSFRKLVEFEDVNL